LWCAHNQLTYGSIHLLHHLGGQAHLGVGKNPLPIRTIILCRTIGAVFPWTPMLLFSLARRLGRWGWLTIVVAAIAVVVGRVDARQAYSAIRASGASVSSFRLGHFALFTSNGALFIMLFAINVALALFGRLTSAKERSSSVVRTSATTAAVWGSAILFFNLFVLPSVPFGAVRHVVGLCIAAVWLDRTSASSARALDGRLIGLIERWMTAASIVVGLALGWLIGQADYESTMIQRDLAQEARRRIGDGTPIVVTGERDPSYLDAWRAVGAEYEADREPLADDRPVAVGRTLALVYSKNVSTVVRLRLGASDLRRTSSAPIHLVGQMVNFHGGHRVSLPWEIALDWSFDGGIPIPNWVPNDEVWLFGVE
jgi:hypothetical protein